MPAAFDGCAVSGFMGYARFNGYAVSGSMFNGYRVQRSNRNSYFVNHFASCQQQSSIENRKSYFVNSLDSSFIVVAEIILSVATDYHMVDEPNVHQRTCIGNCTRQSIVLLAWRHIPRWMIVYKSQCNRIQA